MFLRLWLRLQPLLGLFGQLRQLLQVAPVPLSPPLARHLRSQELVVQEQRKGSKN
jgi:hypothetical protein